MLLGGPAGTASGSTVTVHYATHDATAVAGTDYTAASGTLTFGPGQTVQNVPIAITTRAGAAPARRFSLTLTSPVNATLIDATGVIAIAASGGTAKATPSASAPGKQLVGESSGYVDLPVTLATPGTRTVTVTYATANGTAGSGPCNNTYRGVAGTLTFTPGVTSQTVRIDLNDCNLAAPGNFTFKLSSPTNATITVASTTITIVQLPKAPSAPTAPTARAGNGVAIVSFSTAGSTGGDPINSYTVIASPGGATASSVASPITVTGLTNGTSYTFTVKATNAIGTGKASAASAPVIIGSPAAPTAVTAVAGTTAGTITVSYTLGADNGSAISSQTATCTSSNGGTPGSATITGATAAPITVASLTTGKTYTCTVTATNARGGGLPSTPSPGVTAP